MSSRISRARRILQRIVHYFRHDFREIAWPSSLPDPSPLRAAKRKLTLREHAMVWRRAFASYADSWRIISPVQGSPGMADQAGGTGTGTGARAGAGAGAGRGGATRGAGDEGEGEGTLADEVAALSRMGAEGLRPLLQMYMTRASAYRDALKHFIQGYQEGLADVVKEQEEGQKREHQQ
eukprot:TRINITY_DN3582_c0_g1_i2.p1 TRINITY_DN3582_c0_g1~~TRINITY_DN3582_c0_g1_i2.p1  ORF type:complete len:179 (-),score=52.03 TRINITY_DN3582_c0_g1_i2:44-580(-)